ncbi:MAG: hypothetical protein WKG07_19385 [Hymenobacter sp.]
MLPAFAGLAQTLTNDGATITVEAGAARCLWPGACRTTPPAPSPTPAPCRSPAT